MTLTRRQGQQASDYAGQSWDVYRLPQVITRSVRILVLDVYEAIDNGFIEIEL